MRINKRGKGGRGNKRGLGREGEEKTGIFSLLFIYLGVASVLFRFLPRLLQYELFIQLFSRFMPHLSVYEAAM